MRVGRLVALLALAALFAAPAAPATVSSPARSCSSYPTPGSIAPAGTHTPAELVAEYGVLGKRQRAVDKLTPADLGRALSASGVVMSGTRFLGVTPSGAVVYVVPAEHFLTFRPAPDRCLRPAERSIEHTLRARLKREYTHDALCLLTVYAGHGTSTCGAAPGTVEPLLDSTYNNPGFGLVPNGVPEVLVHYVSHPSLELKVHRNFWVVNTIWTTEAVPCGLDWLDGSIVLRIVKSCKPIVDTS
jgi:hypothetical protein